MSWQTDDGKHEGWAAQTFADGGLGSGLGSPTARELGREPRAEDYGVLVSRIDGRELAYDDWQYRPEAEVTGWVSVCECGWRGTPWTRVTIPAEQNLTARRAYTVPGDLGDSPREVEDACHAEWKEHIRPHLVLAEVADLAEQHTDVGRRLADAVGRARAVGATWTDIGAAAGITRQSAHERWRHLTVPTSTQGA